jgi:hypothetical protein
MGGGLLGCSLLALLLAGSGAGSRDVETTIQDDALMLHRSETQVRQYARQMSDIGADRVRITASWSALAPAPRAKAKPAKPFDAERSKTYPEPGWIRLDRAVRAADQAGLKVQLDIAFWAPRWAVAKRGPQRDRQRFIPDATEFGRFAKAVASRYSGRTDDPRRKSDLPAVRMYTTWNEPNHASFLSPQWKKDGKGGWRPYSPHVYRALHDAAYDAIKAVSKDNLVLVGGTSSIGSTEPGQGNVPPLEFLRTMACVDDLMRPLGVPECKGAGPIRADGYAHHPYSLGTSPATSAPNPDDAPIADTNRLVKLIDDLNALGRTDGKWPIYLTEYGYETKPPDPYARHTPAAQAKYLGWATFLARSNPRTNMFAQFLLRDIDDSESGFPESSRRHWRDWQTGLLYADGRPKPAAQAFKIPLHVQLATDAQGQPALLLAGGVRPGHGYRVVRVERKESTGWVPVETVGPKCDQQTGDFGTEGDGFFTRLAPWKGPGTYRLGWRRGDRYEYGADIDVTADQPLAISP